MELYNEKWFDKPLQTTIPPFRYKRCSLKLSTESVSPFPSVVELHNDTNTCPPLLLSEASPPSPLVLHASLNKIDCLFFIHYLPEDTIRFRWLLVQVNHIETLI